MKGKNIRNCLISFIIGALIFGSIGVAASGLFAKDISFTPSNPNWELEKNTVEDAINSLYGRATCKEWVEITGATVTDTDYIYNNNLHLFKCGNVCKISFSMDGVNINTDYRLITNQKYYPKEDTNGTGVGANNGYTVYTLKTDGNFVITKQSIANVGWVSSLGLAYICDND